MAIETIILQGVFVKKENAIKDYCLRGYQVQVKMVYYETDNILSNEVKRPNQILVYMYKYMYLS